MSNLLALSQAALTRLNSDELEVIHVFIAKLEAGKLKHGPLDLDSDRRDLLKEWEEEQIDGAMYAVMLGVNAPRAQDWPGPFDLSDAEAP
jgi:hypothetical protein